MPDCNKISLSDLEHDDAIVAEIRAIRNELSDRFGGDVRAISRYYMERQRLHPPKNLVAMPREADPIVREGASADS